MSTGARSPVEGMFAVAQPIFWIALLLYLCPGLFSDLRAENLVIQCYRDHLTDDPALRFVF